MKTLSSHSSFRGLLMSFGIATLLPLVASGGSLLTLSNPVADGSIVTTGGNGSRSDWAGVTGYTVDPDEGQPTDWQQVFWAHDSGNFYLRYLMNRTAASGWLTWQQGAFLDTDRSWSSGYNGGWLSVGAEYMLEGQTLYRFTGAGPTDWAWTQVGSLVYDDWPLNDHELTLPRALIGSPVDFNFLLLAGNDIYPDTANGGATGDYFTYTTIPEPAALTLLAVAGAMLALRRRQS